MAARLSRERGARRVSPTVIPRLMASTVSANLATVLGATGPSFTATAACAGGAYNLLLAAQLIEFGHVDAAIAGGVEVADIHFHVGFDAMRAYTAKDNDRPDRASRPYAADRAGFVFSEGAGILVLETRAGAEARGATIRGALRGYGMSSDGSGNMVAPAAAGAELAMRRALDHAEVEAAEIDFEIKLPNRRFNRKMGVHTGHHFDLEGRPITEQEFEASRRQWLPTPEDKLYVMSVMQPVLEHGKMANWISAPVRGINGKPIEFEYIRKA